MIRSAAISDDGKYRYALSRRWGEGKPVLWIMLNPSTADAAADDPTIRRCIGFSRSWGFGAMEVVNLFALRASEPRAVRDFVDAVGPENDSWIAGAVAGAGFVVAAWGAFAWAGERADAVRAIIRKPIKCLGVTRGGWPRHPLYVRGDVELVAFRAPCGSRGCHKARTSDNLNE